MTNVFCNVYRVIRDYFSRYFNLELSRFLLHSQCVQKIWLTLLIHFLFVTSSCGLVSTALNVTNLKNNESETRFSCTTPFADQYVFKEEIRWLEWGDKAFDKAQLENKPVIIHISFATCHWCHVMDATTFSDSAVVNYMNDHFICIKVDKDERPDIDMIYQRFAKLLDHNTGWPLNIIATSDGSPIHSETYSDPEDWLHTLVITRELMLKDPTESKSYGSSVSRVIEETFKLENSTIHDTARLAEIKPILINLQWKLDKINGGLIGNNKFLLPSLQHFLLNCDFAMEENPALITLDHIISGGIYDHLGGGIHRYSSDSLWRIPHFEKNLSDNAQFITLLCAAYSMAHDPLYESTAKETLAFLERELMSPEGYFWNGLDAGSDDKEGLYYIWEEGELKSILGKKYKVFKKYFDLSVEGNFGDGQNVLYLNQIKKEIPSSDLLQLEQIENTLLTHRSIRSLPDKDRKGLVSANALMVKAYLSLYKTFGDEIYMTQAISLMDKILASSKQYEPQLPRFIHLDGVMVSGFLDDYAQVISAFIEMYQCTYEEDWLRRAYTSALFAIDNFYLPEESLFLYSREKTERLTQSVRETLDHELPSSNASMALNLYLLSRYFEIEKWSLISKNMLIQMRSNILEHADSYGMWTVVNQWMTEAPVEVVFTGNDKMEMTREFYRHSIPFVLCAGADYSTDKSSVRWTLDKGEKNKNLIYVCKNLSCRKPVENVNEALNEIVNAK